MAPTALTIHIKKCPTKRLHMLVDRGLALRAQWHLASVEGSSAERKVNVREFLAVLTDFSTDSVPGDANNSSLRIILPTTTSGNKRKLSTKIAGLAGILSAAILLTSCGGSSPHDQDTLSSMDSCQWHQC